MRLPSRLHRPLAVLVVVAGGGTFGASLTGLASVDTTLSAATTSSRPAVVRVVDASGADRCHRRRGPDGDRLSGVREL